MHNRLSLLLLLGLLLISACGGAAAADGPPEINYGRDVCLECGMIISEARFAASYRTTDGVERVFDDIGELLKHGHKTGEVAAAEAWVHDYETEEWVAAEQAYYIVTRSVVTPMAFGIISFDDRARAEAFARDIDADVVGWDIILQLPPEDLLTISDDHDHGAEMAGDKPMDTHNDMEGDDTMDHMEEGGSS